MQVKLWEVYGRRNVVRTYAGHKMSVKDVAFNNDGTEFLSASFDRYIKLWDTETGEVLWRYRGNCLNVQISKHLISRSFFSNICSETDHGKKFVQCPE